MNRPKAVHYDIASDGLYRIDNHSNTSPAQLFERFSCRNINHRKPASESRMAVVPSNAYLLTTNDLKHIKHLLLVDRVNCFDAYCCGELRHREDIDDLYSILIHEFTYHDAHYFKRHACSAVLQHL